MRYATSTVFRDWQWSNAQADKFWADVQACLDDDPRLQDPQINGDRANGPVTVSMEMEADSRRMAEHDAYQSVVLAIGASGGQVISSHDAVPRAGELSLQWAGTSAHVCA